MKEAEFNRRCEAMGTKSKAIPAARDVLVNGAGYRPAATAHKVDAALLFRLCETISQIKLCKSCGQVIRP
jgi:hypothetical protein